ncbi:MAG TPA: ATPase domain-containing protein [Candidatus Elarobacter sp.]|jgi:circadian clock protein KaiC|nr:ATPase domain-containing protein [Candidatus Elarobacter sp.]
MVDQRASSGISGLDEILFGGFIAGRSYLISGPPGTGKTTLGWHFLEEGAARGEPALFVTFGEAEAELRENARRTGFDTSGITVLDLSPSSQLFAEMQSYDIFSPSEVEREPITRRIVAEIDATGPRRVFVDSMTSLRYLAADVHEYRRQALSFVRYLVARGAILLMTSETSAEQPDDDLRFLADGVLEVALGRRTRTIGVTKLRGSDFRSGPHTLRLTERGAVVFPRLVPDADRAPYAASQIKTGVRELDRVLEGGLERGTVTLITGPTGVGKTTLTMQFVTTAAAAGIRAAVYTFDERGETLMRRCETIGMPVAAEMENGTLRIMEVESLRYGADEFANLVRRDVLDNRTEIVMIDSVAGYRVAIAGEDLVERLHALCRYLVNAGVTVLLVNELQELITSKVSDAGISYLADNILQLRYVEQIVDGASRLLRGVGVLKKRLSGFENTIRELRITEHGLAVGRPLAGLITPFVEHRDGDGRA